MASIEKYAAIPFDKYLRLIDKAERKVGSHFTLTPQQTFKPCQSGSGGGGGGAGKSDSGGESNIKEKSVSSNNFNPPPGLPPSDSIIEGEDNISTESDWGVLWQEL